MAGDGGYDDEPVFWCGRCLSLRVMTEGGVDWCGECGSTDVRTGHIREWRRAAAVSRRGGRAADGECDDVSI